MTIVTSQKLFDKYPGHQDEIMAMLKAISPNVDVLPMADYMCTKMHCDKIENGILIVGGPDVVPFASVANPATDPDDVVLTDSPYACTIDSTYLMPNKVIARLPDEQLNPTFDYLKTMLTSQAGFATVKSTNAGWFAIVAQVWKGIADYMNGNFQMNNENVAPPTNPSTLAPNETIKKHAYVNLHGAQTTPYFYGQLNNTYPIAMEPVQGNFKGSVGFFEACYGGYITGRNKEMSIPMMALYSGAVGIVCSTMVAYGPSAPPAAAADFLAEMFYNRIQAGECMGDALLHAKQDFATNLIKRDGSLNGSNRKTLLEFHLYGNPAILP